MGCGCCCRKSGNDGKETLVPIDRGWAWVIVAASAGLFCLITGTFKCFGILKLQIETNYEKCSDDVVLWILSACSIISLLSGVVFSWLLNKTSHRTIGMIGGGLCSLGIFLTAFSPNCYFMFLSLGLIYSFGAGGVMVVVFSAFADYFSKHKGLAVGIMASGSGLGSLVVPQLFSYLFQIYTFRDALICYAMVFLQSLVLAALLRPTTYYTKQKLTDSGNCNEEEDNTFTTNIPIRDVDEESSLPNSPLKTHHPETNLTDELSHSLNTSQPSLLSSDNTFILADNVTPEHNQLYPQLHGSVYSSLAGPFLSSQTLNDLDIANKQLTTTTCITTTKASSRLKNVERVAKYNWKLWCNSQVLMIGTLVFFAVNSINLIFTTAPSFAKENDVEVDVVATIMTLAGTLEIVFRMIHGWLADRRIFSALTQICLIMLACTAASLLCSFLHGVIDELHSRYSTWQYVFYYISACYLMALIIGVVSYIWYRLQIKKQIKEKYYIAEALT
ncbi:monocarboxylate transporter 9-like isoform X2 [Watersipora subatra]|uniref:monocarboxylate transporter 9-like isoform X2 n=1 Tax=Watersipora subatra TaxID=2589382 RepID=UPI00355BB80A